MKQAVEFCSDLFLACSSQDMTSFDELLIYSLCQLFSNDGPDRPARMPASAIAISSSVKVKPLAPFFGVMGTNPLHGAQELMLS